MTLRLRVCGRGRPPLYKDSVVEMTQGQGSGPLVGNGQPAGLSNAPIAGASGGATSVVPPVAPVAPDGVPAVAVAPAVAGGGQPVVSMQGVSKKFGDFQAVQGLNLQVPEGGLIGLIGPSGCGKTTMIRLLLGVYEPSEGDIRVFGEQPFRFRRTTRARIGYLTQHFVLYPTLSVDENLNFAAATYGIGPFKRRSYKNDVLELVGLTPHRHKLAGNISGGMQRRLELAATLLHQPDLIFLDEPTAGIDPILREHLWGEFRRLQGSGRTQIITTQYVAEAEYCDTVVLMDSGEIVAAGPPEDLRQQVAGGDVVDAVVPDLDRALMLALRQMPSVRSVEYRGDEQVRLTVEDAGEIIPRMIATVHEAGAQVKDIEERRLSFNEVFVALLEQAGRKAGEVRGEE